MIKDWKTYRITEHKGQFAAVIRERDKETRKPISNEVVRAARKVLAEHKKAWKDLANY